GGDQGGGQGGRGREAGLGEAAGERRVRGGRPLMAARILDGAAVAQAIRADAAPAVAAFTERAGRPPGLGIVLVGDDPASEIYVCNKLKSAADAGLRADLQRLSAAAPPADPLAVVGAVNHTAGPRRILGHLPPP